MQVGCLPAQWDSNPHPSQASSNGGASSTDDSYTIYDGHLPTAILGAVNGSIGDGHGIDDMSPFSRSCEDGIM
jgi:hypothetical protein